MIRDFIKRYWPLLLIIGVIIPVFYLWGMSFKFQIKEEIKVDIVFVAEKYNSQTNSLAKSIQSYCPDYIKEVNFNFVSSSLSDSELNSRLIYYMDEVDIFVLPTNLINEKYPHLRAELSKEIITTKCGNPIENKWYEEEKKTLGFCVFDYSTNNGFLTKYITFAAKTDYFLFINKNTPQAKGIGSGELEGAYSAIKAMINL